MKKLFLSMLSIVLSLFVAVGCSSAPQGISSETSINVYKGKQNHNQLQEELGDVPKPSKKYKFGVVLKTLNNEHWQEMKKGYEEAAKKYGVDVEVQAAKDEADLTGQLNLAETMLNKGYDLLSISPLSTTNLQPVLNNAKSKGTPVLNVDDSKVDANVFVGGDHREMGVLAAEYIHEHLKDGGKVAQVEGQAGSPAAIQRTEGFKKAIEKYSNLQLVASQPGNWDRLKAQEVATNILKAHPDVKAFYANNDTMALGVVEALKNEGKLGEVIVIGTDGVPNAVQSIRNGELTATIGTFPYDMGYTAVEIGIRVLEGQKVPDTVVTKQLIVDKENVDQHFPNK